MKYQVEQTSDGATVYLTGEIDLSSSPAARTVLLDCVAKHPQVNVDMAAVDYIDSSGVASLVEALQIARSKNVDFNLIEVSQATFKVLALARLDKVFNIIQA